MEEGAEVVRAETPCAWGIRYRSVIGEGIASRVEREGEKITALREMMKKYSGQSDWEFSPDQVRKVAIIRIRITGITGKQGGF